MLQTPGMYLNVPGSLVCWGSGPMNIQGFFGLKAEDISGVGLGVAASGF